MRYSIFLICVLCLGLLMGCADTPLPEPTATPVTSAETTDRFPQGATTYVIDTARSTVQFTANERLLGQPIEVTGTVQTLQGDVIVTMKDGSVSAEINQLSAVPTFATGLIIRDMALANQVFDLDSYPSIDFTVDSISGLPDEIEIGQAYDLLLDGTLTAQGIAQPMTFDLVVSAETPDELHGTANSSLNFRDFGLHMYDGPEGLGGKGVEPTIALTIDFVATAE